MTSPRPFLLLRISFPVRPDFIQFIPDEGGPESAPQNDAALRGQRGLEAVHGPFVLSVSIRLRVMFYYELKLTTLIHYHNRDCLIYNWMDKTLYWIRPENTYTAIYIDIHF